MHQKDIIGLNCILSQSFFDKTKFIFAAAPVVAVDGYPC
jgi:hypothetical protein